MSVNLRGWLARAVPRKVSVLAAEIGGICPVEEPESRGRRDPVSRRGWRDRILYLIRREGGASPHPLYDPIYYLENNRDVKRGRWPPLLHFLLYGGFEGRQPHPLFDPRWYLDQYPDVAFCGLNPLQHYIRFGWREGRNPHPLFDTNWYLYAYPDVKAAGCDPLVHFLKEGGGEGRKPHPLFDSRWYLRRYEQARHSGLNPLVHYLVEGASRQFRPSRVFDAARYVHEYPDSAANPLVHYLTSPERGLYDPHPGYPMAARPRTDSNQAPQPPLVLPKSKHVRAPQEWRNTFAGTDLPVFVVYGRGNVAAIESQLIPALAAQRGGVRIHLHTVNYREPQVWLSPGALAARGQGLAGVTDWSGGRENRHFGFGESVNYLFHRVAPEECFFLLNPDAVPMPGCTERLVAAFRERHGAFIEARQWPSEHPKEYDPATGWTPWASGACVLISSRAFRQLNGFDPLYFLYNEDVDLSWRAWLQDMPVIYEPRAICAHFTGMLSYRPTRYYYEHFFSIRNFLVIANKFFGDSGESSALRWIAEARLPAELRGKIAESYSEVRGGIQRVHAPDAFYAGQVKIRGLNLYHELRRV